MPELPEVETMRRGIAAIAGRKITGATFPRSRVRPISIEPVAATLARRLAGRTVAGVHRRGKRIVIELAAGGGDERRWLAFEPRMTGLMLVVDPPTAEHVRMVVEFAVVTAEDLATRLGDSRRAVKVALLDQRAVAGIGNIYAAEILFRAGIDPRSRCRRLKKPQWDLIADQTRRVLADAVRLEGSSIGDETYRTADNRVGRFQRRHRVYGREGEPCASCGTAIMRIVQTQRATFFCPACQRRP